MSKEKMPQEEIAVDTPGNEEVVNEASEQETAENTFEKQLEDMKKELESTKDTFQRTLAEYDNYRKRTSKEKTENFALGKIQAVEAILPILDTLEFALNAPCKDDEYKKGIEMVMTTAQNAFSGIGVEAIEALGKEFDPNIHSAVMQEESEEFESGFITKELQKGYKMGEKIIRHSTVVVAK